MIFTGDTDSEAGAGDRDNDSLASFLSSVHGLTSASHDMDLSHDLIPTRDTGLMAPRDNREAEYDTASHYSTNSTVQYLSCWTEFFLLAVDLRFPSSGAVSVGCLHP